MHQLVRDVAEALNAIDCSREPFKNFKPGVGPYGEPQLVRKVVEYLRDRHPVRFAGARTKRDPDVLIPSRWALQFKIVRPFGDNGAMAEHWSQNLLHPYPGNVSAMGDALKLTSSNCDERKGIIVIAFEHREPQVDLSVLVDAFELVSRQVLQIPLGPRCVADLTDLIHPVHQRGVVFGWEIRGEGHGVSGDAFIECDEDSG